MVDVSFQKIYIKGNLMNKTREDWLREADFLKEYEVVVV